MSTAMQSSRESRRDSSVRGRGTTPERASRRSHLRSAVVTFAEGKHTLAVPAPGETPAGDACGRLRRESRRSPARAGAQGQCSGRTVPVSVRRAALRRDLVPGRELWDTAVGQASWLDWAASPRYVGGRPARPGCAERLGPNAGVGNPAPRTKSSGQETAFSVLLRDGRAPTVLSNWPWMSSATRRIRHKATQVRRTSSVVLLVYQQDLWSRSLPRTRWRH